MVNYLPRGTRHVINALSAMSFTGGRYSKFINYGAFVLSRKGSVIPANGVKMNDEVKMNECRIVAPVCVRTNVTVMR